MQDYFAKNNYRLTRITFLPKGTYTTEDSNPQNKNCCTRIYDDSRKETRNGFHIKAMEVNRNLFKKLLKSKVNVRMF